MKKSISLTASIIFILFIIMGCNTRSTDTDYTKYVDVFIGTGAHGHTFPGATRPNAMVQFSPDTHILEWESCSGYYYPDTTIYAFSLTHLSGTGVGDLGDVALLPFSKELKEGKEPFAIIDKTSEKASPGYYSVYLKDQGVQVDLTSTDRVGLMKLSYRDTTNRSLLLNLAHILQPNWGHKVKANDFTILDDSTIMGTYYTSGWAYDHRLSYYIRVKPAFASYEVIRDSNIIKCNNFSTTQDTANIQVKLFFPKGENNIMVKVGISPVSELNAKMNMIAEIPNWDFDKVRDDSKRVWNNLLSQIKITTPDTSVMTNFYTSMYHMNIAPYNYQDVNGEFRGLDKKIHKGNSQNGHYTVFSIWDTYRALNPLLTIIDPDKALKYGRSLVDDYKEGGILPKWPLASNYTGCMPAYHSVSILADLVAKGIAKNEDIKTWAKAGYETSIYRPDLDKKFLGTREHDIVTKHPLYRDKYGFIPSDLIPESVSWAVEMAYDDWCIARLAEAAGLDSLQKDYDKKALYYRKYWDSETKFMRPIISDGKFLTPFNPRYSAHQKSDYTEGNAYQWSFYAPHDMKGFINLMGGKKVLEARLDTLFTTSSHIDGNEHSGDITGLMGQYAHGNEPSHHIAYLYDYTDSPCKGQKILDSIMYNFYTPTPEGIIGNEDCGQMSAWYIMSALGFYQICPGDPVYFVGRPIVNTADIKIKDGVFRVITYNNSRQNKYIDRVTINGKDITDKLYFSHFDIKPGGKLEFWMRSNKS